MTEKHTFIFAPETEESAVAILWHQPKRMAGFLRDFDSAVVLSQPHLQHLVDAINLAYGDLGETTFAVIVQTLRELGHLEDCGGVQSLDAIYRVGERDLARFTDEAPAKANERTDRLFTYYCDLLREYAEHRQTEQPKPVYRFAGGRGTVHLLKDAARGLQSRYSGDCVVRGSLYRTDVQVGPGGEFLNFQLTPK